MAQINSDEQIREAARAWLLLLSLEEPSAEDRRKFHAWCQESPRHKAAYARAESIWQDSAMLQDLASLAPLPPERRNGLAANMRRWVDVMGAAVSRPAYLATGIAVAAALMISLMLPEAPSSGVGGPLRYATGSGEMRDISLADGSKVTLGPKSSIEVAFDKDVRHVALTSGEAFFAVEKNPRRPFIVAVGDKRVRVVGTKFDVRRGVAEMHVSVLEGTVEVSRLPQNSSRIMDEIKLKFSPAGNPQAEKKILKAGQQVTARMQGAIEAPQRVEASEPGAWRKGQFVYVDTALREIVADANRYSSRRIEIADSETGDLIVSVACRTNQVDSMLESLARSLPIEVEHLSADHTILRIKKADI